ncbi:unnamed protein product [Discosporangium mesarthrocarpum]
MRRSRLNNRLRDAQEGNPTQYYAFEDTAYATISHVKRESSKRARDNPRKTKTLVSKARSQKCVCNLWEFLDHKRSLEFIQNPVCDPHPVGVLLTTIHTCKYGSQVIEYYCELPPSVKAYFQLHGHISG